MEHEVINGREIAAAIREELKDRVEKLKSRDITPGLAAILLGLTAALGGILVGGIFDHYFFNLSFPHSVSIFWIFMGLAMVAVRLGTEDSVRTDRLPAARPARLSY